MFREFWLFTVFVAMLVSARQSNRVRTRSAQQVQPFPDPNWCWDNPDRNRLEHENCEKYWECDENNELFEEWCDEGWIFDFGLETCEPEDVAFCWSDNPFPDDDAECPLDSTELIFLPGDFCDEYYLCNNGQPSLMRCREGQHWNDLMLYCDHPHLAGCDPDAIENPNHPSSLPNCGLGVVGTFPHPNNCNWFVYCDNGNRSIQQCQHLFHYDTIQNRCIILTQATCIKDPQGMSLRRNTG